MYRPGIVVGSSETGEADKIDGPYYLLKPLQHLRKWLPQIVVLPCIEGETQPIVPVDYVVKAMDAIAHKPGLDKRAFHLVDPSPPTLAEMLNIFAKAMNAPTFSTALSHVAMAMLPRRVLAALSDIPIVETAPNKVLARVLGVPDAVMDYVDWKVQFDDSETRDALRGSGVRCPKFAAYAWKLTDYYERHMDTRRVDRPKALQESVRGKLVVITGASDGIGETCAKRMARAGARVVLIARNKDKLAAVVDDILKKGGIADALTCDISKGDDCTRVCKETIKKFGVPDVLVNNAGRSIRRSVEYQCDPSRFHDFERTIALNYYGAIRMILGFLPGMRERKSGQIINISSVGVITNAPRFSAYVASKAALDGFTRCISAEIAPDNVNTTTIYMPLVRTKMVVSKNNKFDHMRLLTREEASGLIERAVVTQERTIAQPKHRLLQAGYMVMPSLVESLLSVQYQLEPEAPPEGQDARPSATGDTQQLRAIGQLLKGGLGGGPAE